jgi:hypothetical protein
LDIIVLPDRYHSGSLSFWIVIILDPLKKTSDAPHEGVFREVNVHQDILVHTAYEQMVILALLTGMDRAAPRDAARFTPKV